MGLHVTSVAQIVDNSSNIENIEYFVYVLNYYQIKDEVLSTLIAEIPNLQSHFAELGNAAVITGVKNVDFANEVLSWHNVVGLDAADVCPAILICTLPPHYFSKKNTDINENEPWILLELGKLCTTSEDLKKLLQRLVSEVSKGSPLSNFEASNLLKFESRPIITGKLKYLGVELDHKALMKRARDKFLKS